jgi:uncharacterized membrane protein YhiD involved in acid resistance
MWDYLKSAMVIVASIAVGVGIIVGSSVIGLPGAVGIGIVLVGTAVTGRGLSYLIDTNIERRSSEDYVKVIEQMKHEKNEEEKARKLEKSEKEASAQEVKANKQEIDTINIRLGISDERHDSTNHRLDQLQRDLAVILRQMPFGEDSMQRGRGFIAGEAAAANDTPAIRQQGVRPRR